MQIPEIGVRCPDLNRVHRQRIGLAVRAALDGGEVVLASTSAFDAFGNHWLVWRRDGKSNVIGSGTKGMIDALLPAAQAEFERQLKDFLNN